MSELLPDEGETGLAKWHPEHIKSFIASQASLLHTELGTREATELVELICSNPSAEGLLYDALRFQATLPEHGADLRLRAWCLQIERFLRAEA